MGFRFRRSARLGPLRFNFAKGGLSSVNTKAARQCLRLLPL